MRFRRAGILLLGAAPLAAAVCAQTTPAPTPPTIRTVVAGTKLPTVTDTPLYFKVVWVTLPAGERSDVSAADGILYQVSGVTEISIAGELEPTTLSAGLGLFIPGGTTAAAMKASSGAPSTFLHFF